MDRHVMVVSSTRKLEENYGKRRQLVTVEALRQKKTLSMCKIILEIMSFRYYAVTDLCSLSHRAGASVVLHKDSAWKESWKKFKENNPVMQGRYFFDNFIIVSHLYCQIAD